MKALKKTNIDMYKISYIHMSVLDWQKVRGIQCLNFPQELTWSRSGTFLECPTCLEEGCYQNIFAGPCNSCADAYHGVYGTGCPARVGRTPPVYFGNWHPSRLQPRIVPGNALDFPQPAINPQYAYTVYNLAMQSITSDADWDLLLNDNTGVKQLWDFYSFEEYASKFQFFLRELVLLREEAKDDPQIGWSKGFYKKCVKVERKYKGLETMRTCNTCGVTKFAAEIRSCQRCKLAAYCSVACQDRDYHELHQMVCGDELE